MLRTEGREREKARLQDYAAYYRAGFGPHYAIIDIIHDWADGQFDAESALDQILAVVDQQPTSTVLGTASRWSLRAAEVDAAFEGYAERISVHRLAPVRAEAARAMNEPRSSKELGRFQRLLADRSAVVRQTTIGAAEYGRWFEVVTLLRASPEAAARDAADLIYAGFEMRDRRVRYYSGTAPGGAYSITSAPLDAVVDVPFARISEDELTYRSRHNIWPTRPDGYNSNNRVFAAWRPVVP